MCEDVYEDSGLTQILKEISAGDGEAAERLFPFVYDELRRLASYYFKRERQHHTLQPTALVHEAYIKLAQQRKVDWNDRGHFFAVAAQVMRRLLVDHARRHAAEKHGGANVTVALDEAVSFEWKHPLDLIDLDEALRKLELLDRRKSHIVQLKFFAGLSVEETAAVLDMSERTVQRDWQVAKLFLYKQLAGE